MELEALRKEEPPAVVNISFAYQNAKLIHLLRERGTYIKEQEWKMVKRIEAKIDHLKETNFESFVWPVSAFITFKTEDGYNRAQQYEGKLLKNTKVVSFREASEPSDIIWENR